MLSPWQVFGDRPAHQEGASDFQWVRARSCGDDVLLVPTAPTAQLGGRAKGDLGRGGVTGSTHCCLEGIQFIQITL